MNKKPSFKKKVMRSVRLAHRWMEDRDQLLARMGRSIDRTFGEAFPPHETRNNFRFDLPGPFSPQFVDLFAIPCIHGLGLAPADAAEAEEHLWNDAPWADQ